MKADFIDNFKNLSNLYDECRLYLPTNFIYTIDTAKSLLMRSLDNISNSNEFEKYVLEDYFCNSILWFFEDKARDTQSSDSEIASVKRAIDYLNQRRNDAIELINEYLYTEVFSEMDEESILISETPGALIDRLSILHLKKYFLKSFVSENTEDSDAQLKYDRVLSQIGDLLLSLKNISSHILKKDWYFKLYFNNKLYNDPKYNKKIVTDEKTGDI